MPFVLVRGAGSAQASLRDLLAGKLGEAEAREVVMAKAIKKSGDPRKPWKLGKLKTKTRADARSIKASKKRK